MWLGKRSFPFKVLSNFFKSWWSFLPCLNVLAKQYYFFVDVVHTYKLSWKKVWQRTFPFSFAILSLFSLSTAFIFFFRTLSVPTKNFDFLRSLFYRYLLCSYKSQKCLHAKIKQNQYSQHNSIPTKRFKIIFLNITH